MLCNLSIRAKQYHYVLSLSLIPMWLPIIPLSLNSDRAQKFPFLHTNRKSSLECLLQLTLI